MSKPIKKTALYLCSLSVFALALSACTSTTTSEPAKSLETKAPKQSATFSATVSTQVQTSSVTNDTITLEKIMADPDWLGRQPERPYWSDDGRHVFYQRKREGSVVRDLWQVAVNGDNTQEVQLSQMHEVDYASNVKNRTGTYSAWLSSGDVFVKDLRSGSISQLTRGVENIRNLLFLNDNRIAFQQGNAFFAVDTTTGLMARLAQWKFAEAPKANKPAKDYIAEEQQALIQYVQTQRVQNAQRFTRQRLFEQRNDAVADSPYYLSKGFKTINASLSPAGNKVLLMIAKDEPSRDKSDIMPHYIQDDGRIAAISVRKRVLDETPVEHQLWLLDIVSQQASLVKFNNLPGFNEDVLADEKRENAQARGEEYEINRLPRHIALQQNWFRPTPTIAWNSAGDQVALMLEAWDNKDRWLATVDFATAKLVTQHRLHDDAWINYRFNDFGWLNNSNSLFYLSEESGYSSLYVKPLAGQAETLVSGNFVVDYPTLTRNDQYIYFTANKVHPGLYEVYRVALTSGEVTRLTELHGNTQYQLGPNEQQLLLTHSKTTRPPELYVQAAAPNAQAVRVTNTISDAFLAMPWVAPEIVPVPSSHIDRNIYARVYRPSTTPANQQNGTTPKHRAVVFNHGAGYLQNSHMGWSVYFREFMFHSMLAQQGYVVMDMDFRASAGYGRDWRTAIYRHMGKSELEDLRDGVNWMVENLHVDRNRVGTYGGSYGGFLTFMALFTEPDLFQAGAALRPVTDWAHYNGPYTSNILNAPDVDPIAYERSSPIYFAEGLEKPLLINAPMVDDNVFFVDVVRLVQRLIELEKQDFETAIYPVEPHGFVQPSSWLDEYRRIYKLFENNL